MKFLSTQIKPLRFFLLFTIALSACGEEKQNPFRGNGSSDSSLKQKREGSSSRQSSPKIFQQNERLRYGGREILVTSGELLKEEEILSGSTSFVFIQPLAPVTSNQHFSFSAEFEEGGFIEFFAFVTQGVDKGITLRLEETSFTLAGPGGSLRTTHSASLKKSFSIDVHNSEDPTHVIVWDRPGASRSTPAILDTAEDSVDLGIAEGVYYGFRLTKAKLLNFRNSNAKITH